MQPGEVRYDRKGDYLHFERISDDPKVINPPVFEIIAELQDGYLCVHAGYEGKKLPTSNSITFVRSTVINKTVTKL